MKKVLAVILTVVLVMSLSVTAFAADSATGVSYYGVYTINGNGAATKSENVPVGESITMTADEGKGDFDKWIIYKADGSIAVEGVDYTIEGALTDKSVKITPKANIIITGNYNGVKTEFVVNNGEPESPKTGDTTVATLAVVMLVTLAGACVAKKQLAK